MAPSSLHPKTHKCVCVCVYIYNTLDRKEEGEKKKKKKLTMARPFFFLPFCLSAAASCAVPGTMRILGIACI